MDSVFFAFYTKFKYIKTRVYYLIFRVRGNPCLGVGPGWTVAVVKPPHRSHHQIVVP